MLRILRLRPQNLKNPKDPKKRMTRSGSVKVRKYSDYSIQFQFAFCNFEKCGSGSVKVRQK